MKEESKVKFLGSCGEVQRSSILVSSDSSRVLMDYGVRLSNPPEFPLHVSPKDLDALVISHAHLDHTGGTPLLYVSRQLPVYTNEVTMEQVDLLIRDFLKLSGPQLPFEYVEMKKMRDSLSHTPYRNEKKVPNSPFRLEFVNSGHIPGSASVTVQSDDTRLLYTSDVNHIETQLVEPASLEFGEVDAVITESTYGGQVHPDRREEERRFVERVRSAVSRGGTVLIPTFAIGRSQEVMLILEKGGYKGPLFMDGMAVKATRIYLRHKDYIKEPDTLQRAMERTEVVDNRKHRQRVAKRPGAIIAPAGMLGGGSAVYYMSQVYSDEKDAIFIVGFQAPGTPGKMLVERKQAYIHGKKRQVNAEVESFKFSSHTDSTGFEKMFDALEGSPPVFVTHGDEDRLEKQAELAEEMGFESLIPEVGEEYAIGSGGNVRRL